MITDLRHDASQHPAAGLELLLHPTWEQLCASLAEDVRTPPQDPFGRQLVVTQQPAARRALSQQLALRLPGVCAAVDFWTPRRLRRELERTQLGVDAGTDPWRSRGLALAVLDVMDQVGQEPWFAPVAQHLGDASRRPGRRLATADRIARLLLRYCRTSPQLVRSWNQGTDQDLAGAALPARAIWQPRLWRLVRDHLQGGDPVSRHDDLVESLAHGPAGLPDQVLRLVDPVPFATLDRELVGALSRQLPTRVWQLEPAAERSVGARWGATARLGCSRWDRLATSSHTAAGSGAPERPSVLQALQVSLRGDGAQPVSGPGRPDGSVQVHASHGPDRQVEVLREVLCGLFADDPTLEPREVVVASTDLAVHAPLVRAAFCLDPDVLGPDLHPGHQLRVELADASLSRPNQVLETLRLLLRLAGDRATAQDLVDLCTSVPVATRFDLGPDEHERIRRLVQHSDVRWGLDAGHRAEFGLGQVRQSTWLAGVERVLVGIAMGPAPLRWLGTALPVEHVDGSDVMAAGTLAEIVSRARKLVTGWRTPAPVAEWTARLAEALDLLVATSHDDAWQLQAAHAELADLADLTLERTAELGLGDVQGLFDRLLRPAAGRANHGNGSLLVGTLDDIGQVAHRVVVVLGLDDLHFPARPALDGDDLTTWVPADAENDARARSRQLLLDALQAARDTFVVIHQGFSPRTNDPLPEPVAVLDLAEACAPFGGATRHRHSLQPQSRGNFRAAPGHPPASFDQAALKGAQARELLLQEPAPLPEPLWQRALGAAEPVAGLDVSSLADFYRHPARELLRRSLGVGMSDWSDDLPDEIPVEPDALAEWAIGDRMVRLALEGLDPDQVELAERLRGELPPGALGSRTLNRLMPSVRRVVQAALRERESPAKDLDCELPLAQGGSLAGRVRVHDQAVVGHAFSRTSANHLLGSWFDLLLLAATQEPGALPWRAVHVGRDAIATLVAPPPEHARELLDELVTLRQRGLEQLVPLPPRTAAEHQRVTPLRPFPNHDADVSARKTFGREHDADWARFVGDDLEALRRLEPLAGDPGPAGPSRFENLADWLFRPLREQLSVGNLR